MWVEDRDKKKKVRHINECIKAVPKGSHWEAGWGFGIMWGHIVQGKTTSWKKVTWSHCHKNYVKLWL